MNKKLHLIPRIIEQILHKAVETYTFLNRFFKIYIPSYFFNFIYLLIYIPNLELIVTREEDTAEIVYENLKFS